jgi:hypothetical protein
MHTQVLAETGDRQTRRRRAGVLVLVVALTACSGGAKPSPSPDQAKNASATHDAPADAAAGTSTSAAAGAPSGAGSLQELAAGTTATTALPTGIAMATPVSAPTGRTSKAATPKKLTPGAAPASSPSAPGPANPGNPTSFRFTSKDAAGRPARWDPCTPVRWALNPDQAPPGALELAKDAFGRLAAVGGLKFTYAGTTAYKPLKNPETAYPAGVDAVVAFASSAEYPDLSGGTFGIGGFTSTFTPEGPRIVHGGVVLSSKLFPSVPDGFGRGQRRGGAILHEMGHMVGLDHVNDTTQIMNPALTASAPEQYVAGDSNGLRKVGSEPGCFTVPNTGGPNVPTPTAPTTPTVPH